MFPIALDVKKIPILLVGEGEAYEKRKRQLEEMGVQHWAPDIADAQIVMVAGLSYDASKHIADEARAGKKLVNVEDVPEFCDFYFTSFVRRGDLTIAVSTNGASPTLAKRIRERIALLFSEEWVGRTAEIKALRDLLRAEGRGMKDVMQATDALLDEKGWLA